jgi:hypothetical protein
MLAAILARETAEQGVPPHLTFANNHEVTFHRGKVSRSPELVLEKSASPERALRVRFPMSGLRSSIVQM